MRKLLLAMFLLFALIGCSKQPTVTTDGSKEQEYPFVDENGKLNVESNHQFGWGGE